MKIHSRKILTSLALAGLIASTLSLQAQSITTNFSDGNGTANSNQYAGTAGEGWQGGWVETKSGTPTTETQTLTNTVVEGDPLNGGGNYLSSEFYVSAGSNQLRQYSTSRQYGNYGDINLGQSHRIQFDYRFDNATSFNGGLDQLMFFDHTSAQVAPSQASSWVIAALGTNSGGINGGVWAFYNGAQNSGLISMSSPNTQWANSTMAVDFGTVYRFTIDVDPENQQWSATISNGTETISSGTMGFNRNATTVGGYLNFAGRVSGGGESQESSYDSFVISTIPEPSHLSMALGILLLALYCRRAKTRNG